MTAFVVLTLAFASLAVASFRPFFVSEPVRLAGPRNVPHGGTR